MQATAARRRIAHDALKPAIRAGAAANRERLARHELWGTGTDILIFFIDPLGAIPHGIDVKALDPDRDARASRRRQHPGDGGFRDPLAADARCQRRRVRYPGAATV